MRKLLWVILLVCICIASAPGSALADNGAEFDASPAQRLVYRVLTEGETDQVTLEVENSGTSTWNPEDEVQLRSAPFFKLLSDPEYLALEDTVAPGEVASWTVAVGQSGTQYRRFQMVHKDQPFGSDFALVVIIVPEEVAHKRDELEQSIQAIINEWKARGEEELDRVMEEIKALAEESLKDLLSRIIDTVREWGRETGTKACNSLCGSASLVTVVAAIAIGRRRR